MALLEVKDLQVYYGMIQALKGISFNVDKGEIIALIGANGAGKTTTLQAVTGLLPKKAGTVTLNGTDITKLPPHKIVKMGMAHVPEGRRVFARLTVYQNLNMGAYTKRDKDAFSKNLEMVYEKFPRLKERSWQYGGTLSGGEQQMLAVGRALMSKPKLMMMDEPSLGLAPLVVKDIFSIIEKINKEGVTILLIEQNANMALKIADIGYVMETGQITLSGKGSDLISDEGVRKAYLGG